jgi:hypothetical protein
MGDGRHWVVSSVYHSVAMLYSNLAMTHSARLESVQSPIIPIVEALIRNMPGTISLGQGVVMMPV